MIEMKKILFNLDGFSRYQKILLLLFCIINVLSSIHYYSQTIISFVPDFWCKDHNYENSNELISKMRGNMSSCYSYWDSDKNETCTEFVYDHYMGYKSLTSELNWICGAAWKITLGQSMFFVGSVVGTFGFGILADIFGRVPILIISNLTAMMGNLFSTATYSLASFCMFRFVSGLATDTNFVMMYILVMEYINPAFRTMGVSICIGIFYCLGSIASPWIAVLTQSWKMFLIVTSLPFAIVPLFYFIIPESIQWLVSKQKYTQAAKSFERIAKINHEQISNSEINRFIEESRKTSETEQKVRASMLGLFKTPRLRKNTLILFFKSMVITLCYDAVSRNVQGKGVSPFIMFSLSATTILPACLLLILLQDRIGRKAMSSLSLLTSGMFISASGIILMNTNKSENNATLLVFLAIIGRFGVTVAYNSGAQYATELIPTCVRGQGIAAVHVIGYAFTFLSSYILHTRVIYTALPEILLGLMSFLGAALCLFLPETTNRKLPDSLEDGENFGKGEKCFSFICIQNVS
ncbi:organic cation transporter-like protein [Episyrphus balteatus]|uniref:organic cation transporter-like protein n=1 Tax=Episyrphus balteatus TaxID=286459 RepID=UPI002485BB8B|nr:organic cation transporter-like protein [Episyrphus balteatus]